MKLPPIIEQERFPSPAIAPQALAWQDGALWMGSRDLRRIYGIDLKSGKVFEEQEAPGIPWAAVAINGTFRFTIGEGPDDDRYIWQYTPGAGFSKSERIACPDYTGSYLSYDGENLYLSQWYEQRILKLDESGNVVRKIEIGAEICGHVFANGALYVLRGTENVPRPTDAHGTPTPDRFKSGAKPGEERWWIARLDPKQASPEVQDLSTVPFACRSLAFDGKRFWSNHRAANEIISFTLPA